MVTCEGQFVRLNVPVGHAVAFAMGWSDYGYRDPTPAMRRIVGELAVDGLQYSEHWREAALLRDSIERKWPCEE